MNIRVLLIPCLETLSRFVCTIPSASSKWCSYASTFHSKIFIYPQDQVKDIIYQMDAVYIRKRVYKGKPEYPIEKRKPIVLVNERKVAPKWQSIDSMKNFFKNISRVNVLIHVKDRWKFEHRT